MPLASALIQAFAPNARLRASINLGNPVLAAAAANGGAKGVSVDLARAFAERLGVALELVVFDTAGQSVEALEQGRADIGFFAVDPKRAQHVVFTEPYVLIEGTYLVRDDSPLRSNEEVDRAGHRVVVGEASAYDLYLTRELKNATILRARDSAGVIERFLQEQAEVAAGVKQQLEMDARRVPGMRLLPGRFMVIRQAMGCARVRGEEAARELARFVEEMKASGFVAQALKRHGIQGATVAPPAGAGA